MAEFLVMKLSPGPTRDELFQLAKKHQTSYLVSSNIDELNIFIHSVNGSLEIHSNKRFAFESTDKLVSEKAAGVRRLAGGRDSDFHLQSIGMKPFRIQVTPSLQQNMAVGGEGLSMNLNSSFLEQEVRPLNPANLIVEEPVDGNFLFAEKPAKEDIYEDGDQRYRIAEDLMKEENMAEIIGESGDGEGVGGANYVEVNEDVPDLPSPSKTAFGNSFACNVCGFFFPTFNLLQWHHNRHHPFCIDCGIRFRTQEAFNSHKYLHRICDICGKGFPSRSEYNRHKVVHTGEKNFECDVCHKTFALKGTLKVHMRTHTGEKPHQCDQCQKAFTTSSKLCRHRRCVHGLPK